MKTKMELKNLLLTASLMSLVTSSLPIYSFAGANTGGGGGSIVCFNSPHALAQVRSQGGELRDTDMTQIDSIEAYDLFQARLPRGIVPQPTELFDISSGENTEAYIERVASRFDKTVPAVSDLIRWGMNSIRSGDISYAPNGVAQLDDADAVVGIDSARCALVTTAHQYSTGDRLSIAFDNRIMSHPKQSNLSRAVLIMHEAIYAMGRKLSGQSTSRPTRDLLSIILRKQMDYSAGGLLHVFDNLGFKRDAVKYPIFTQRQAQDTIRAVLNAANRLARKYDDTNSEVFNAIKKSFDHCNAWYTLGCGASGMAKGLNRKISRKMSHLLSGGLNC